MSDAAYDVVVVGAGIGGLALAILLARRGYRVLMVEPQPPLPGAQPPVFRVGESLDWEAPVYLRRLGLSVERWVADGKATFKAGAVATTATQPGVEAVIGFSPLFRFLMRLVGRGKPTAHTNRERVDGDLSSTALEAGVELVVGRAQTIEVYGDRVTGVVLKDSRRLGARFYVDAAGSAGLFRRAFRIGQERIGPRKVVVRARFVHGYDGMGTRIRTDETLSEPAWIWDINVSEAVTDSGIVLTDGVFALNVDSILFFNCELPRETEAGEATSGARAAG